MITLYQEQIPFSNKILEKSISTNGQFTNPVIMPFSLDFTSYNNCLETVVYLRNDSQEHYYKNVVVSLMKLTDNSDVDTSMTLTFGPVVPSFSLNGISGQGAYAYEYSASGTATISGYKAGYSVVKEDNDLSVKFSYGYDEISNAMWASKRPVLVIPTIGTQGTPNLQYIPIRMRLNWKQPPTLLTIRDYFIDVSYESENNVTG